MKQIHIEKKQSSRTATVLIQSALRIVIIVMVGISSLSLADNAGRTKRQLTAETEMLDSTAAIALTMEAYREIQSAMIEADFQERIRASARLEDPSLAVSLIRMAAKKRDLRLQKLTSQLGDMQAAYNGWAGFGKNSPPPRLDLATAAASLREIAASSTVSDLDPHKKMLVAVILHPTTFRTTAALAVANVRSYSPLASWLASATTVAQHTEVHRSGLVLLAVVAIIVVHRMSRLVAVAEGPRALELWRRS